MEKTSSLKHFHCLFVDLKGKKFFFEWKRFGFKWKFFGVLNESLELIMKFFGSLKEIFEVLDENSVLLKNESWNVMQNFSFNLMIKLKKSDAMQCCNVKANFFLQWN